MHQCVLFIEQKSQNYVSEYLEFLHISAARIIFVSMLI